MKCITKILAAFPLMFSLACSQQQAAPKVAEELSPDFRAHRPEPTGPTPELKAPTAVPTTLHNGLTVMTVNRDTLPLVHFRAVFRGGNALDPQDLPGLAGFVGSMLREGTKNRSASELADELETLGGNLSIGVSEDATEVSITVLKENFPEVMEIVADVLQNPAFAQEEIDRVRKSRLAALAQQKDNPQSLAQRVFQETIFGKHPYGHTTLGTEAAVKNLKRADLQKLYARQFHPKNAAMILVGDIDTDEAESTIAKHFGTWTSKGEKAAPPPKAEAQKAKIVVVPKAGAPQSQLRIGHLGMARDNPDYFAAVLGNAILGGIFNSRINMNLREDKGYTYGAYSRFGFFKAPGYFVVSTGVRSDVTAPAIQEVLKEIQRMRDEPVTEEELQHAKNSYSLSLPGYFQTLGSLGSMMASIYTYELPNDYYQQLPDLLAKVTVEDVQRVAQTYLQPDNLSFVVVGDEALIREDLTSIGQGLEIEVREL